MNLTDNVPKHLIWKILLPVVCTSAFLLFPKPAQSLELPQPIKRPVAKVIPKKVQSTTITPKASHIAVLSLSKQSYITMIRRIGKEVGLKDVDRAIKIANCESGINPKAIGDHGWSYGIWQIYLKAHPNITKAQAQDPEWSTRWALTHMKQGHWNMWSCNRKI